MGSINLLGKEISVKKNDVDSANFEVLSIAGVYSILRFPMKIRLEFLVT